MMRHGPTVRSVLTAAINRGIFVTVKDARKNALSEIPLITGVTCLTIPCEPAKKSDYDIRPIYLGHGYACVFCGGFFFRCRPCLTHMGMVMNIPCSCDRANDWHKKMAFDHKLRCAFCDHKFSTFEALGEKFMVAKSAPKFMVKGH